MSACGSSLDLDKPANACKREVILYFQKFTFGSAARAFIFLTGLYYVTRNIHFRSGVLVIAACLLTACGALRQTRSVENEAARRSGGDVARKMFEQRCVLAGENIYKQVENVEGIFLLKLRPEKLNFSDQ